MEGTKHTAFINIKKIKPSRIIGHHQVIALNALIKLIPFFKRSKNMTPETLQQIDTQLAAWKAGQPLSESARKQLHSKQDLLWSYNSNHLEGNTLSYGETELLLIHGEVTGNHSARDVDEMRAHHVAVTMIRHWAQEDREITEADIRNINQILLKEPFTKETATEEGIPASRLITPGVYKRESNHVKTASGELFRFAEPLEVPAKMEIFTQHLREPLPDNVFDIAARLAHLHHEFILIHPFDDGNGRTIRLLLNYVLVRDGLPAIVIKSADKAQYLQALRLADAKEYEALVDFLLNCMKYALDLGVKAINGESLEEPNDVEMKIALLKQRLVTGVSPEKRVQFFRNYIIPFWKQLIIKFSLFDDFFEKNTHDFRLNFSNDTCKYFKTTEELENFLISTENISDLLKNSYGIISTYSINFLRKYSKSRIITTTDFTFEPSYVVMDKHQLSYSSTLTQEEVEKLVSIKLKEVLMKIENYDR